MGVVETGSSKAGSGIAGAIAVDICICTYHRPAISNTLRSLSRQRDCDGILFRVVVADNAADSSQRQSIEATARELGLDVTYVHAPARNISIARNACLDAARQEWLAFLDDDEIASPMWLCSLVAEAKRGNWDAVLGPVEAVYSKSAPHWIRAGDFHSTRPVFVHGRIETGYTGNVLIRRAAIVRAGLRFRTELGRSGGEDEDFFNRLRNVGGRIGFAPAALAYEAIAAERTSLRWLMRRNFRAGQTYGAGLLARSRNVLDRFRALMMAMTKAIACSAGALFHLPTAERRNRFLTRAALHCGVVARLAGLSEIKLY